MAADRKYFYVLENAYTRNIPMVCFVFPDNCLCPGDDCIETFYFDRGIYNTDGYCWCSGCVGGKPQVFYDELKFQCCCIECYDNVNQCLGCNSRQLCGERIRVSPFDRCLCCIQNKYCWLCSCCGLFGPVNNQPICLCPIESGLARKESGRLKKAMDKAREEWEDNLEKLVNKESKQKSLTETMIFVSQQEEELRKAKAHPDMNFAMERLDKKNKPTFTFGSAQKVNPKLAPTLKQQSLPAQLTLPNLEAPSTNIDDSVGPAVAGFAGSTEHHGNASRMYALWDTNEEITLSHEAIDREKDKFQAEEKKVDNLPPDWVPPHHPDPVHGLPQKMERLPMPHDSPTKFVKKTG